MLSKLSTSTSRVLTTSSTRSICSISSLVSSSSSLSTSLRLRTFSRSSSTFPSLSRSFSTSRALDVAPPSDLPSLRQVKKELVRVLEEDASDLSVVPDEDISEYITEQGLRITLEKDLMIKVSKTVENYRIAVDFSAQFDSDAEEKGRLHEEALAEAKRLRDEDPETSEEEKQENKEEDYKAPQHSFTIRIRSDKTSSTSPSYCELGCYADPSGQLAIESFSFDDPETHSTSTSDITNPHTPMDAASLFRESDESNKLYFDDLNDSSQDKTIEWLETMGIDDTFSVFVQQYAQMVRAQKLVEKMKNLKQFLAQ